MTHNAREPSLRHAFTLIELLVVISVVALLIGILLPALGSARLSARQTQELSAIRQLGMGMAAYTTDNADKIMPGYLRGSWARPTRRTFLVYDNPQDSSDASR